MLSGAWRHLAYNYREGGLGQVARKIGYRFRAAAWSDASWLVYRIDLTDYHRQSPSRLTRSSLDFDSLRREGYVKALAFPEVIRSRLASGSRCAGFWWKGELANLAWFVQDGLEIEPGVFIHESGAVGIYDCLTLPQYRGRGFYTESLIQLAWEARAGGAQRALIAVDPGNVPSIKGIERAGFEPLYQLSRRRRLGRQTFRRIPFELRFPRSGNRAESLD